MNIQWYPGHMTKTRRMIAEQIKNVDAVCEILDARIPVSSRNPDVDELTAGKPRLVVLNRVDQADPEATRRWAAFLLGTFLNMYDNGHIRCGGRPRGSPLHRTVTRLFDAGTHECVPTLKQSGDALS